MLITSNEKIIEALLDEEYVLYNPINNSYINLNDSASLIWGLIKTPTTKDSIIKKLLAITNAKPQTLKEDLDYFLKEAKDKDLINFSNEKKI